MSIFKAKPLPHHIVEDPKYQLKERVQPGKAEKIQEANDEFFVLNMARGLGEFFNWLIIGGPLTFLFFFFIDNNESFGVITYIYISSIYDTKSISFGSVLLQPTKRNGIKPFKGYHQLS